MTSPARDGSPPPLPSAWDGWLCLILVGMSVAVHGWVIHNTSVTARDSIGFARYALNLGDPNAGRAGAEPRTRLQLLREEKHPPGYPAAVYVASLAVRPLYAAPLPDQMLRSAQVASAVAAALLVFPLFRLGRLLFGQAAGFWAALLFQLLPVVARDTSDGLSDGPFLLAVGWAVAFGTGGLTGGGVGAFFRCGLAAGCAYLIRPEGLVVPVAGVAAILYACARRVWPTRLAVSSVVALIGGTLLVGGPYMLVIGHITNKPAMLEVATRGGGTSVGGPLFADSFTTDSPTASRLGLVAQAVAKEWFKAGHYGIAGMAVVGSLLTARRVRQEPRFWVPVTYAAAHLGVVLVLGFKKGYVSERHLLPVMLVGVVFAVGGLPEWFRQWCRVPGFDRVFRWRHWPAVTAFGLAATCVPPLLRPLHENRTGHKRAGAVLRDELARLQATDPARAAGAVVIDHYEWAQFFAGRSLYRVAPDPPAAGQTVVYVVLELKDGDPETAVFDSDRHKDAKKIFNDEKNPPEWVYHWPEDEPRERAKVVLARQVRK